MRVLDIIMTHPIKNTSALILKIQENIPLIKHVSKFFVGMFGAVLLCLDLIPITQSTQMQLEKPWAEQP